MKKLTKLIAAVVVAKLVSDKLFKKDKTQVETESETVDDLPKPIRSGRYPWGKDPAHM